MESIAYVSLGDGYGYAAFDFLFEALCLEFLKGGCICVCQIGSKAVGVVGEFESNSSSEGL